MNNERENIPIPLHPLYTVEQRLKNGLSVLSILAELKYEQRNPLDVVVMFRNSGYYATFFPSNPDNSEEYILSVSKEPVSKKLWDLHRTRMRELMEEHANNHYLTVQILQEQINTLPTVQKLKSLPSFTVLWDRYNKSTSFN